MRHGIGMTRRDLVRLGTAGAVLLPVRAWASEPHAPAMPKPAPAAPAPAAPPPVPVVPPGPPTLAPDRTVNGLYGVKRVSGVALAGFDPVSYFLAGEGPLGGRPGIAWRYAGVDWCFANSGNREAFRRDTAVYLPRCGGFDPLGIVAGRLVEVDPLVFALAGGRLYLFRDAERRASADAGVLAEAERRYPALLAAPE